MRTAFGTRPFGRGRPNRVPQRGDDGFTLVEMLVALVVVAVVMATMAPAFYAEMKASSLTNYRSAANGVAVAAIEQMRAFPYYEVGWDTNDYASGSTSQAESCVTSTNTYLQAGQSGTALSWDPYAASSPPVELPYSPTTAYNSIFDTATNNLSSTETISPITYNIYRCVYWMDSSTGQSDAYKLIWVGVSWTTNNTSWHISQTSALYPSGEGAYTTGSDNDAPSSSSSSCTNSGLAPSTPTGLTATYDSSYPSPAVDLSWSEGSNPTSEDPLKYPVYYGSSPSGPWTQWSDNSILSETVDGLTSGVTYYFEVYAAACDGTESVAAVTANVATPSAAQSCTYSNFSVTPTSTTIGSNDKLDKVGYFQFSLQATSGCSNIAAVYSPKNDGSYTSDSAPAGSGSLTWDSTASKWVAGTITFNLQIGGSDAGSPLEVTITCDAQSC